MATGSTVERGHSGRVLFLAIVAAIGGFLFGFDTAVINGAVDAIEQTFGTSPSSPGSSSPLRCWAPLSAAVGGSVALPYLLYAIFALLSFVFVSRAVQETKGRELEEMQ